MIVETPYLDEIPDLLWNEDIEYNMLQLEEVLELTNNHIWVTANREQVPVKNMSSRHISNCIKCFNGEGKSFIPPNYLGGKDFWIEVFNKELSTRQ